MIQKNSCKNIIIFNKQVLIVVVMYKIKKKKHVAEAIQDLTKTTALEMWCTMYVLIRKQEIIKTKLYE